MISLLSSRLLHQFQITIYLTSFYATKYFWQKKKLASKMLIEQIIEFKLREPGPLSRTCTPKPGYFHDKTKISKANQIHE